MAKRVVMYDRPAGPKIRPLQYTSPTTNEDLRSCFMRVAFSSDQRFSDIRPISTFASLGSISHRLLEAAHSGEFDTNNEAMLQKAIHNRWLQLVQIEVESLQNRAHDTIPSPVTWPKYALRMVAACKAAYRVTSRRIGKDANSGGALTTTKQTKAEVWYEGHNGRLAGRIDLICYTNSGIQLLDYKSGIVTKQDDVDRNPQQLREEYERQMLLYAALIHENEGQWPKMAIVESLLDGSHVVDFTPENSEKTVKEALQMLEAYNLQAATGKIEGTPNRENCRWCNYKVLCRNFMQTADESWTSVLKTIIGRVVEVHTAPRAFLTLEITGGDYYKRAINIRGIPVSLISGFNNLANYLVSFGNLKQTIGSNDLVFGWSSGLWRWLD